LKHKLQQEETVKGHTAVKLLPGSDYFTKSQNLRENTELPYQSTYLE